MALFRKKRGTDDTIKHGAKLITVADPRSAVSEPVSYTHLTLPTICSV